ncbi:hypothetical protein [Dactylosporangium sp. NPDC051541]|uniref:hypothetical protein n=1 Tax=Dactylosporangium sp. NPDC051541 TaxID=3363977 RepID=UPI0037993368
MTEADGPPDSLRVPPWLPESESSADAPHSSEPLPPPGRADAEAPIEADAELAAGPADDAGGPPDMASRRRMVALVAASALVVVAVLAVGVLLTDDTDRAPLVGRSANYSADAAVPMPGETGGPAGQSPALSPAPSASSSAAGPTTAPPEGTATSGPTGAPKPVRFGPVTIEAEAAGNAIGGSAWVDRYPGASGGRIVRNLGDWDDRRGPGILRFEDVSVPATGTYTVTVFHVNIDNEPRRTLVVAVNDEQARSFALRGGSTCCTASTLRLDLRKGRNTIAFGNPSGHAPSLDRIVVARP